MIKSSSIGRKLVNNKINRNSINMLHNIYEPLVSFYCFIYQNIQFWHYLCIAEKQKFVL